MGYSIMISITDERFICQEPCEHLDCESLRQLIETAVCNICDKKIIASQPYYQNEDGLTHRLCVIGRELIK